MVESHILTEVSKNLPLRIGSPDQFQEVQNWLRKAGFETEILCKTLNIPALSELDSIKRDQVQLGNVSTQLALCIQIFLFGEVLPDAEADRVLSTDLREVLISLDLLRPCDIGRKGYYSSAFLYPAAGFLMASDRHTNPDSSPFVPPPDVVFPAIFPGTLRFLRMIPDSPAARALDLCSGSGIGALVLSRRAQSAIASDITSRATHFADFNRRLNGCANVEVAEGDLYAAVAGSTFDRIVGHPPYVPSLGDQMIFRDGGEAGETILRRMVEGLPQHLRPNGTFCALGIGHDTKEGRFEERVRNWLGDSKSQFDIVFACADEKSPKQAVQDIAERAKSIESARPERLLEVFNKIGTIKLAYGALFIRRNARPTSSGWTARPRLSAATDGSSFEWLLSWRDRRAEPLFAQRVTSAMPRLAPDLRIKSTHVVHEGALVPAEFLLETDKPFATVTRFDLWVIPVIAKFDGKRTVAEIHQAAATNGEVPENFALSDFVELVALLVERGYLILEDQIVS